MNAPIELQAQKNAVPTKLGFLENSPEHMCMKAFKEHPRGLVVYEQSFGSKFIKKEIDITLKRSDNQKIII